MKLTTTYNDEVAICMPDNSVYIYILLDNFVHLVHKIDGSHMVISHIQFQTLLHKAKHNGY